MQAIDFIKIAPKHRQAGLTLVELMISMTLGLFVVAAALALLLSSKAAYSTQDDAVRLQDTGQHAIDIIARSVRAAGYADWDKSEAPLLTEATASANVAGLDAHSLKATSAGMDVPLSAAINGSDVLALRFFGTGKGITGDGAMLNCAGFGVPAPTSTESADDERGWSIFYVATDASGEPELRCKYKGENNWSSDAIARGVESFQVLYGLDTDTDGLPNRFLPASAIDLLDDGLVLSGDDPATKQKEKSRKTHWKKVVAVKVGLLVRGFQNVRVDSAASQYDLLGKAYGDVHADTDSGTRIDEAQLPASVRRRLRKVFTLTIPLRNPSS